MENLIIKNVAVISRDDEEYYNLETDRGEILDCDYAQTAIVVDNEIIYWNDNCHSDPELYMKGFIKGLKTSKVPYKIEEIVMYAKDLKNFTGVKY